MSKLSLGVEKAATSSALVRVSELDALIESAGDDLSRLRAAEEMAEAIRRWSGDFEDRHAARVAASAAKLKIARTGGRVLKKMAEQGERKMPATARSSPAPGLDQLGLSKNRSSRWQAVAAWTEASFGKRLEAVLAEQPDEVDGVAHVGQNAGDSEWYTPESYIKAAVRVMGGIDLDPASTAVANEVVGAARFYTEQDDGLTQPWAGRVWMNPPYSQPLVGLFCNRLADEFTNESVTEAFCLINNATETVMFQRMAEVAAAICFPARRVPFWHPEKTAAPLQGQAVIYFGEHVREFCAEFKEFGFTVAVVG